MPAVPSRLAPDCTGRSPTTITCKRQGIPSPRIALVLSCMIPRYPARARRGREALRLRRVRMKEVHDMRSRVISTGVGPNTRGLRLAVDQELFRPVQKDSLRGRTRDDNGVAPGSPQRFVRGAVGSMTAIAAVIKGPFSVNTASPCWTFLSLLRRLFSPDR